MGPLNLLRTTRRRDPRDEGETEMDRWTDTKRGRGLFAAQCSQCRLPRIMMNRLFRLVSHATTSFWEAVRGGFARAEESESSQREVSWERGTGMGKRARSGGRRGGNC
ncbi:uncharacterized protein PV07_10946 [Cladophialophora immunda]|uniref:Uncharacterized protein n=1 Tax=Cladophialophora immunda TaxID=569365 RepID=A0A0D2ACU0_9EURO|nr:uncharacterized protein PV07_10946 [Cladophialophora immunda]KIW22672.1 hypothetical protein PV07_10946 [Cladophialophora immunda]